MMDKTPPPLSRFAGAFAEEMGRGVARMLSGIAGIAVAMIAHWLA